jgi:hypothetical protein
MKTQSLVVEACEGERLQKMLCRVVKMAREEGFRKDLKSKEWGFLVIKDRNLELSLHPAGCRRLRYENKTCL